MVFLFGLTACGAKAKQMHGNTGSPVFKLEGSAFTSLDDLFAKANETCDDRGYTVSSAKDSKSGDYISYSGDAGIVSSNAQLVVQCKGGARTTQ